MSMEKTVIEIFGIASLVVVTMSTSKYYAWFVGKVGSIKPFNCELCMSLWSYAVYSVCLYGLSIETILGSFLCAYVGYAMSLKFMKW